MSKNIFFLVFCTVFVAGAAFSQQNRPVTGTAPVLIAPAKPFTNLLSIKYSNQKRFAAATPSTIIISPSFYCSNLAFFCRQELKVEKITRIPFRFRLGSVQYTDWLEQKPNAINPLQ